MTPTTLTAAVRRIYRDAATRGGLSDADLLARFAATRDEAAFEVLVWRHGPMVLGVCRRVLGNVHDAEDAFQAAFLALASRAGAVGSSLPAWLHRVSYHAALRLRKRRARRAMAALPADVVAPEPTRDEASAALDEELRRLPRKYREPLVLAYLQGRSNQEVAEALGCPIGTVFTRLSRGRERLRAALARRGLSLAPVLPAVALAESQVRAAVATSGAAGVSLAGGALALAAAHKMKSLAAALLLVGFVAVGMFAAGPGAPPAKQVARAGPPVEKNDLPAGAVVRLGTLKFRHADGKTVVTAGEADSFRTWDLATGDLLAEAKQPKGAEWGRHLLLPGGKTFARIDGEELSLIDTATGKRTGSVKLESDKSRTMTASPDGSRIAVNEGGQTLGLYTLATGKRVTIPLPAEMAKARGGIECAFSPDNKLVALSAVAPDPAAVRKLIAQLNGDTAAERDAAERDLSALGELALPFFRSAFDEILSEDQSQRLLRLVRGARTAPEQLRRLRAVGVLERSGTADARAALREVAGGAPAAPETAEAAAALRRLAGMKEPRTR